MKIKPDESLLPLGESTLPMINVVFLLLIFFMIAGSLQKTLPFDMTPPTAEGEEATRQDSLILYVATDGRIMVGDQVFFLETLTQLADKKALFQGRFVTLRADYRTNTTVIVKILAILRKFDVQQVVLATVI